MEELTLNIYDENDKVIKTCKAQFTDIRFGAIRKLMALLNIENVEDTYQLLKIVYEAWDRLTAILSKCFPDITDEDWDNVKLSELMPVLVSIIKSTFAKMMTIPAEKN